MAVMTRPLRGARQSAFYPSVENPDLKDLDSAFQIQEYIALMIRKNPHDVDSIVALPTTKRLGDSEGEEGEEREIVLVDESCWIYEQLRRLAQDLTYPLITSLQLECNRSSCPEMKAGEWLYLCVAHGNDSAGEQCCAIDYILHILDSATALLNSPRAFPSRIQIPPPSVKHFSSLARRLGRIFAHAFFHHREAFEAAEAENGLYARFLALTTRFDLVPPEFLVHPPRMQTSGSGAARGEEERALSEKEDEIEPPRLLAASLNPNLQREKSNASPEKSSSSNSPSVVLESPRKLGRNRTDTMIFSDEFGEQLREQMGSPLNLSGEHEEEADEDEDESRPDGGGDRFSIPHTDNLEIVASSDEKCGASSQPQQPYTLAFSASGSIKNTLPPGVAATSVSIGRSGSAAAQAALQEQQQDQEHGQGGPVELSAAPGESRGIGGESSGGPDEGRSRGGIQLQDLFRSSDRTSAIAVHIGEEGRRAKGRELSAAHSGYDWGTRPGDEDWGEDADEQAARWVDEAEAEGVHLTSESESVVEGDTPAEGEEAHSAGVDAEEEEEEQDEDEDEDPFRERVHADDEDEDEDEDEDDAHEDAHEDAEEVDGANEPEGEEISGKVDENEERVSESGSGFVVIGEEDVEVSSLSSPSPSSAEEPHESAEEGEYEAAEEHNEDEKEGKGEVVEDGTETVLEQKSETDSKADAGPGVDEETETEKAED